MEIGGKNAPNEKNTRLKISKSLRGKYLGEKSPNSKRVYKFSLDGELIEEYGSVIEASRKNNISNSQIASVCRGEHYIAKGYRWSYKKDFLAELPRKSAFLIEYNNKKMTLKDWSIFLGLPYGTLLYRIDKGWDIKRAFEEPLNENKRH